MIFKYIIYLYVNWFCLIMLLDLTYLATNNKGMCSIVPAVQLMITI